MNIYDIKIEYRENPIGLSVKIPRFSWKIQSKKQNTIQKFYQIIISNKEAVVWDSKKVKSNQSILIPYDGKALMDETYYHVKIIVETQGGECAEGNAYFETGIFEADAFVAQMITHDFPEEETACPIFYKTFLTNKKIKKAHLYATAHGVYEVLVNKKHVTDHRMMPGWTSYHKRLQFQHYDITKVLEKNNKIEFTVGNGWYKGILGFDCQPNRYGNRVAIFAEIHIHYEDGSQEIIATDETWKVTTGIVRYSEIYMGEIIDTQNLKQIEGKVLIKKIDKKILCAQENEPVRIIEKIPTKDIFIDQKRNLLVDFGQNLTGVVELKIKGRKGQKIIIRHAEVLDKDGNFYPDTLRQAKSEDIFICSGEEQVFLPHFTFHGFRYIAIKGIERKDLKKEMLNACVIHSDMEPQGTFHCSNSKVNQLQSNIIWGQKGNFLDIPTDCPQRDERLGWTGDAQVFSWTASYNFNTARFFSKWLHDIAVESSLEKGVPHIVPDILGSYSSSAWSDAAVIIPWVVYQCYGDIRILEESWKCMHEWVDYIKNQSNENGLWMSGFQYGDWLALDKEESADRTGATDRYMIANAYYLYVTDIVKKTAKILGKIKESEYYETLYDTTIESFQKEYFTERGRMVSETQTGCVLALYFNLSKEKDREKILKILLTNIENHKQHLSTGFVGTPYICHALSENGAHEIAATLFMREDYPSWLYAVNMGATTIWERWNSILQDGSFDISGMNSLNHYAYGSIGDWMYRKVAGINQIEPGYQKFYIKPMFVIGIESVESTLQCPYGTIKSAWSCKDNEIQIQIEVPANTTALLYLPEKEEVVELGSGCYEYKYPTETCLRMERFSFNSTLGEIMEQPLAVQIFKQHAPEIIENPLIKFAYGMSLSELAKSAPEGRALYESVIVALNQQK